MRESLGMLGNFINEFAKYIPKGKKVSNDNIECLQSLLPYRAYCQERDFYLNENSTGFMLEISPLCGANEKTIDLINGMLVSGVPQGCNIQVLNYASPKVGKLFNTWSSIRDEGVYKELAKHRTDYYKSATWRSLFKGDDLLIRDYRVFVCVSMQGDKDVYAKLDLLRDQIKTSLGSIGSANKNVSPDEFLSLMHELLYPNKSIDAPSVKYNPYDLLQSQIRNPEYFYDLSDPDHIDVHSPDNTTRVKCYSVREFPELWSQWQNGDLLGDFLRGMQIPCPFIKVYSFTFGDEMKMRSKANAKLLNAIRESESGIGKLIPEVFELRKEWQKVVEEVRAGAKLVDAFYQVILFSDPEQMQRNDQLIKDTYNFKGWTLASDKFIQMQSWQSMLPFAFSEGLRDDLEKMGRLKTQITSNAANIIPLQGEYKGLPNPYLMLIGRHGQPQFWNPFSNREGNFNTAIVGKSGSGKSMLMQELVTAMRGAKGRVIVIDDGESFKTSCANQRGEFIYMGGQKQYCINPFSLVDVSKFDNADYRSITKEFISNVIKEICYGDYAGSQIQDTYIDNGILWAIENKGRAANIGDVGEYLSNIDDARAKDLGLTLTTFVRLNKEYFIGEANVNIDNEYVVFELSNLKDNKRLKGIILLLIMFIVFMKVYMGNRKQATSLVIDEAWDLLSGQASGKFIEAFARRARKYFANLITGTQGVNDYYKNAAATAAIENTDWMLILSQKDESIEALKKSGRVSMNEYEESVMRSLKMIDHKYSEVMIKGSGGWSVGRLILDPYSIALYSSKAEDVDALRELQKQGLSLEQALEVQAKNIGEKNGSTQRN